MEEVPEQHAQDAQMQDGEAIPAEEEEEKVELTEYEKKINEVKEMLGKSQKTAFKFKFISFDSLFVDEMKEIKANFCL